KRVLDRQRKMR
ncbi:unnamed protein product, partial [Allacma fusca]